MYTNSKRCQYFIFNSEHIKQTENQQINRKLNNTINQINLIDINKTFHLIAAGYTFSSAHERFSRIDNKLRHRTSFYKLKNIKSHQVYFSTTIE